MNYFTYVKFLYFHLGVCVCGGGDKEFYHKA